MVWCHPTAVVSPQARIASGVRIGPYSLVEEDVEIGEDCEIASHVVLARGTRLGQGCRVFTGAVIGNPPQDLKYSGEQTFVFIGDRTTIREFATINRGTRATGKVLVGSDCLIMAYCHIAHDCVIGDHVILSNVTQLAGHVTIGEWAVLGGVVKVHQFCSIGKHAMVAADAKIVKDVPPYALVGRDPPRVEGINRVGLQRRGFALETIQILEEFYRIVFFSGLNMSEGIAQYLECHPVVAPEVQECIDFIRRSQRGVYR
ncbi:MAG: acyl-ACP--UDP-N-acetylglucosamine O-acyltransferase [Candidatus Kapabacteria bacterium]|nr:acyl-ACP--UDP-N-acetylglucosamine O-acyltransferase [Candidatus Kapabacteria bacterium]MDW7996189.1 acyl-ACP--UDP-N-acetylglucosamine O-acyltransferase [Bacteroidota bacterium]MDW8224980.1 acyl-ACP--UDP-N-acetylglucosamine O-acyltransferase [Bacteroidota bacterium]